MEQEAESVEAVETVDNPDNSDNQRPEWLPEKFNDPAELGKAYKSLESKLGEKEETLREQLKEELHQERFGNRPASSGDYELPEMINPEEGFNNELLQWWADHSYENGYSQEQFQSGIERFAQYAGPDAQVDIEAELKQLGDNGEARVEAASMWAEQFFPEEVLPAIELMCQKHQGIVALEMMMQKMRDPSVSENTNVASGLDQPTLEEMSRDERYWNPAKRDMNFVRQVDEGYKKLYNG